MLTIVPPPLRPGDRVAILSPSSIIAPERVFGAMQVIADAGYFPVAMPHTFDRHGTMAGTDAARLADLTAALTDPSVKAVFCSRGGYGAVHLLSELDRLPLRDNPKWLIGYSDITALHCLMTRHGIASLHAPMARHLAETRGADPDFRALLAILRGEKSESVAFPTHPLSHPGTATGILRGGNLSVLMGLVGTPFDPITPGCILAIEDVNEPIYKVERMLYNLLLSGRLSQLSGIIFGTFTNSAPTRDFASLEQMASRLLSAMQTRATASGASPERHIPVAFGFPIGHTGPNRPLPLNTPATLTVAPASTTLEFR